MSRDLATTIARGVLDRIESDRCCNSENIADAVYRELAVNAAAPAAQLGGSSRELVLAAEDMLKEIEAHIQPGSQPSCFHDAHDRLRAVWKGAWQK